MKRLLPVLIVLTAGVFVAPAGAATLKLNPTSGPTATSVTATGTSFGKRRAGTVVFGTTQVATFTTAANGSFSKAFTVPSGYTGATTVRASTSTAAATATFNVTAPPPPAACADGVDNDGDGLTDYPADPGCTSATDTDETDVVVSPFPTTWRRYTSFESSITEGTDPVSWECLSPFSCTQSTDVGGTDGTHAVKIVTNGGNGGCSCARMKFQDGFDYTAGRSVWITGSWYVTDVAAMSWERFMNLGHYVADNDPSNYYVGLVAEDGRNLQVKMRNYYGADLGQALVQLGPIPQGRWFTVAVHFVFSPTTGQALTEAYMDGTLVGSSTARNMLNSGSLTFFNGGLPYYSGGNTTVYFDAAGLAD